MYARIPLSPLLVRFTISTSCSGPLHRLNYQEEEIPIMPSIVTTDWGVDVCLGEHNGEMQMWSLQKRRFLLTRTERELQHIQNEILKYMCLPARTKTEKKKEKIPKDY